MNLAALEELYGADDNGDGNAKHNHLTILKLLDQPAFKLGERGFKIGFGDKFALAVTDRRRKHFGLFALEPASFEGAGRFQCVVSLDHRATVA